MLKQEDQEDQKDLTAIDVYFKVKGYKTVRYFIPKDVLEKAIEEALEEGEISTREEFFKNIHVSDILDKNVASTLLAVEDDDSYIIEIEEVTKKSGVM